MWWRLSTSVLVLVPLAQTSQGPPAQPIGIQGTPTFFGRASKDVDTWVSVVSNYFAFMSGTPSKRLLMQPLF